MILEALLNLIHGLVSGAASWIGSMIPAPPAFITEMGSAFTQVVSLVPGPVLHFVPLGPVLVAVGVTYGLILTFGVVRFARRVLSIFTGGGGNA